MFYVLPILAVTLLLAADRLTKWLVASHMAVGQSIDALPGFARIYYIVNDGAAFGLLSGGRWLFVLFAVVATFAVCWFYVKWPRIKKLIPMRVCLVMIAAGILGNAYDRAVSGDVVDFIDFTFVHFAVFNAADICITCGALALAVFTLFGALNNVNILTGKIIEEPALDVITKTESEGDSGEHSDDGRGDADE